METAAPDFSFPHVRKRPSAAFAFSDWAARVVPCAGRAPRGMSLEQSCSSRSRCFKQYCLLQVWQATPTFVSVLMYVLQTGWEHCCEVRRFGFVLLVAEDVEDSCFRRAAAHAPAWGHSWPDSVLWSRQ